MNGHPSTFLTLTVNPRRGQDPSARAQELSDAWKLVVKRSRRKFTKQRLEYFCVFEETKKGEPHLHIIARAPYIPQRWLSEQMRELIDAPIVDIRRVGRAAGVARYVAKYVAKGPKSFGTLKRYWCSPGYDVETDRAAPAHDGAGPHWYVIQRPLWLLMQDFTLMGYEVIEDGPHGISAFGSKHPKPPWQRMDPRSVMATWERC